MKDERLFMRFPIIFDEDPTIEALSDGAFRAFVSMNGYSRRNDLDGRVPKRAAIKRWGEDVLAEIIAARDDSPILAIDGDVYVLTKYAKHQQTTGDREVLSQKRADAARIGNAKRWQGDSKGIASVIANGSQNLAESESESEIEISDTKQLLPESLELNAREFTEKELGDSRAVLEAFGIQGLDDLALPTLIVLLLEASPRYVDKVAGYVRRCTQRSPVKVRNLAVEAERQASRVRSVLGGVA